MPPTKKAQMRPSSVQSLRTRKGTAAPRKPHGKKQPARHKTTRRQSDIPGKRKKKTKRKRVPGQKRYRRIKVFRPCVIRLVFLVPIAIIAIERYLGFVISLDDVKGMYYDQMGIDPWELQPSKAELLGEVPDISNLTYTPQEKCPNGQRRMMIAHNPQFYGRSYRNIPNIIHQVAKTRCLTRHFNRATFQWAFRKFSYYIHDIDAVWRLIKVSNFPEFPHLSLIVDSCLPPAFLLGLHKFLVLWTYGGILADLNIFPTNFNATTISNEDDGFFLLEEGSSTLSTLVMAVSPRHPLMYYAIQHSISNILKMRTGVMYNPREVVGEGPLNQAVSDFRRDFTKHQLWGKKGAYALNEGTLVGIHTRSIRIGGRISNTDDGIVSKIFISRAGKRAELEKLGMEEFEDDVPGTNCVGQTISHDVQ